MAEQDPTPEPTPPDPTPSPEPPAPEPDEPPKGGGDDNAAFQRIKAERDTLRDTVKDLNAKLADAKTLQDIEDAKTATAAEYGKKLLSVAIDAELIKAGCVNAKAAKALIETDGLELEGDAVKGLDVAALAKEYPYLFTQPQKASTGAPPAGAAKDDSYFESMRSSAGLKAKD
ncbi:MAG: phage scaffolding protein [Coriobacteriia bacterium]|nr:phage scaffolding protein [Coriobacteriia bacterium]